MKLGLTKRSFWGVELEIISDKVRVRAWSKNNALKIQVDHAPREEELMIDGSDHQSDEEPSSQLDLGESDPSTSMQSEYDPGITYHMLFPHID